MAELKIEIHFPRVRVEEPIICNLIRNSNVELNILKAQVTPNEEGVILVSLDGPQDAINAALKYLDDKGLKVQKSKLGIAWQEERCTDCGACLAHCPTKALAKEEETHKIEFDNDKCIACELCLSVCPYHAVEQIA